MTRYKLITDFSKYTADGLVTFGYRVHDHMTDNLSFVDPPLSLSDLKSCVDVLALANSKTGDNTKDGTAFKLQSRATLDAMLKLWASYVQNNGKNDPVIMLSSGFELQKAKSPIGPLAMPQNLRAVNTIGISGSVKLTVAPVPKANGYMWKYTEFPLTDGSIWESELSTAASISFMLKGRTDYVFCVAGIGSDPTKTFSDKLTFFVV